MKHVVEVNDLNFEAEVLASDLPVLIDFSAEWCPPCKMVAPLLEKLARERAGAIKVTAVDIEESPHTANRFGVRAAPTFVVLRGGNEVRRRVGALSESALRALMETT